MTDKVMPKWEPNLNKITCTIGPGINFGTNSYKCMIPTWMLDEGPDLPEGWAEPTFWVQLDSGVVLPSYVEEARFLKFIEGLGDPRRTTW